VPSWYRTLNILQNIWIWSEFVVLLTNAKRRAIHDYLAGTVVILKDDGRQPVPAGAVAAVPGG